MKKQLRIKSNLLFLLTVIFTAGSLFAQPKGKPRNIPNESQIEQVVNRMTEKVELNNEQQTKIHDLFTSHFDDAREIREENKAEKEIVREDMNQHRDGFEKEIKSLLTEVQIPKFEEFMDKHKQRHNQKRQNNKR